MGLSGRYSCASRVRGEKASPRRHGEKEKEQEKQGRAIVIASETGTTRTGTQRREAKRKKANQNVIVDDFLLPLPCMGETRCCPPGSFMVRY